MRRFVVQVLIDTIALLVTIALLSLIEVAQPFPFGSGYAAIITVEPQPNFWLAMVVSGFLLTVTYSILRPVIIMLTGRLLLWSMGLFQVVVIAIVLWVVGQLTPLNREAADPRWLFLLVAAVLVGVDSRGPRRRPRPRRSARRLRPAPGAVAVARPPADAATERPHREPPPPAGVRHAVRLRRRHRPRADAAGPGPRLVAARPARREQPGRRT